MATICPKCKKGTIKKEKSGKGVRCERYIPTRTENGQWTNKGTCNFHLFYENKFFGDFTEEEMKNLLTGKEVIKGDKVAVLDVNNPYFIVDANSELEDF